MRKRFILPALMFLSVGALVTPTFSLGADEVTILNDSSFEDFYNINDTVNFPNADKLYFRKSDGSIVKAVYGEITFPNGEKRSPGNYKLSYAGKYELKYIDSKGNEYIKVITVNKTVFETTNGVVAEYKNKLPNTQSAGLALTMVSGGSFRLNKPVNLRDFPNGEVKLYNIYPFFRETLDDIPNVNYVSVKLLDAYDTSKFVEFYTWSGSTEKMPYYVGAGAAFQNFTGLEDNKNRPERNNCVYEGYSYFKHVTTRYQSVDAYGVFEDFGCNPDMLNKGGSVMNYNINTQKVTLIGNGGTSIKLVTDFDSSDVYDKNVLNFDEYFTTGEVIPQIECFGFNSSTMYIELPEILGLSGEELTNGIVEDTSGPTFRSKYSGRQIFASINKEFKIPTDIEVIDFNYYNNIKTTVYYNYGSSDQVLIQSKDTFTPTATGEYTIVYTATDAYGNVGIYTLPIQVVSKAPFTYEEVKVNSLVSAYKNVIPSLDVTSYNEGLEVKAYAISPNGEKQELQYEEGVGYNLIPFYIGKYKIRYELKDDFYVDTYEYEVDCNDSGNIYFDNEPVLNPAYMKDAEYSLEEYKGKKASVNGPVEIDTKVLISYDNGSFSELTNEDKFKITGNESVRFKFTAGEFEKTTDEIAIIDTGFGKNIKERNYSKYFYGNYASATDTHELVDIGGKLKYPSEVVYNFTDAGYMTFINPISSNNFKFDFKVSRLGSGKTLEVKLFDQVNSNNYLSAKFYKTDANQFEIVLTQTLNGEDNSLKFVFYSSTIDTDLFKLYVSNNKFFVSTEQTAIGSLEITHAFESSILSVISNGSFDITTKVVNNQTFSGSGNMYESVPQLYINKENASFNEGDTFEIKPVIATCVLSPVLKENIKLSVEDINNNIMNDINGKKLENVSGLDTYVINLKDPGQYKLSYKVSVYASDGRGAQIIEASGGEASFVLNVNDSTKPVIKFSSVADVHLKTLEVHYVRSYTVSDNYSKPENILVRIMITDDHYNVLESGYHVEKYGFRRTGTYYVLAMAMDEAGNLSNASYKVIVED